ncbi:MAG: RNA 2',3'-cyclic phosphodiesterase [Atopobiaceae bacterium]|nr:RNA 2',3'-cyclic phosphodiesterase [Atopobiaceae bacterium]
MRLFVAAELPEELLDALAETSAALRDTVRGRYVAPDSLHVTLAFLGEVEGARLPEAEDALVRACDGHEAFEVTLGELGSFGRPRSATLWQAINGGEALPSLAADVRTALDDAGFSYDAKPFRAHITLMRAAMLSDAVLPMPFMARGIMDTVTLFKSDLSGPRPVYTPLARVSLPLATVL